MSPLPSPEPTPGPAPRAAWLDQLTAALGPARVVTGPDAAAMVADPRHRVTGAVSAVVRPAHHDQVVAVMQRCADAGVVVVPHGGNTGMSSGQVPVAGDRPVVALSTVGLDRILDIDPLGATITVEAGVTVAAVQEAAAAADRLFAPDWGAVGSATVGGAVATNAGGLNVVRYGSFRAHVLGLRVVLADGRTWDGLRSLRKDSSGYDLKQLFIGSEGTLGVVTAATLALQPPTRHSVSAWASLPRLDRLPEVAAVLQDHAGPALTALELLPGVGVADACRRLDRVPPAPPTPWQLLIRLAAATPVDDLLLAALTAATDAGLLGDVLTADTASRQQRLWAIRHELSPSVLYPLQTRAVKGDLAVPVERMPDLVAGAEAVQARLAPAAITYAFGHVGDGNLHLYVLPLDRAGCDQIDAARSEITAAIDQLVVDLGGTISGEHGVGRELIDRIGRQKPDVELDLMGAIKSALDPGNRMNPGVMLPPR
ncbi:MAG: FAD-binding oxidoreductase [Acidimicrobiales bacterium]